MAKEFSSKNLINFINHITESKEKSHMFILIYTEKAFSKI